MTAFIECRTGKGNVLISVDTISTVYFDNYNKHTVITTKEFDEGDTVSFGVYESYETVVDKIRSLCPDKTLLSSPTTQE